MKTILELLETIEDEQIRNRAIKNCTAHESSMADNLITAIETGFVWKKSPEGFQFWCDVCLNLQLQQALNLI